MARYDKTIVIATPLSDVFYYVSQPEHFPQFLPMTDLTFLTHMRRGVDTRIRYNCTIGGKRILTECSLTRLEVDERVEFHATRGMACDWSFAVKEVEGGTQLRWECEYEMPVGFLDRLLGRAASIQQAMGSALDESLQKIKEALELK